MSRQVVGTPVANRVAINGNAGADVIFDLDAVTTAGGTERIQPAARIDISSATGTAVRVAGQAGEITAGRYFTVPAGSVKSIEGPVGFNRLYLRSDAIGADTVEILVYR